MKSILFLDMDGVMVLKNGDGGLYNLPRIDLNKDSKNLIESKLYSS